MLYDISEVSYIGTFLNYFYLLKIIFLFILTLYHFYQSQFTTKTVKIIFRWFGKLSIKAPPRLHPVWNHRCTVICNFFRGGTWGCEKMWAGVLHFRVLLHFYVIDVNHRYTFRTAWRYIAFFCQQWLFGFAQSIKRLGNTVIVIKSKNFI